MKPWLTLLYTLCLLSAEAAFAQKLPTPLPTTLPPALLSPLVSPQPNAAALSEAQLLARILTQNPGLLAAQESLEAARAAQKSLEASLWPLLGVNSQFTAGSTQHMSLPVPGVEPANMSMRPQGLSANLNVTAMYPLFTGGKLQAQIEGGKRQLQQAESEYALRRLELRTEALTAMLNLRWQAAQAELLEQELESQREALRLAEERLALGKLPRYVVLRARSELASLQQALHLRQLAIDQQKLELCRLAALPQQADLPTFTPLSLPPVQLLPQPAQVLPLLAERSPQLAILRAQLSEAETRVQIAQSSYLPFVYLVGVYEQRFSDQPDQAATSGGAVDLLISLPVFDGFKRDAELERFQRDASRLLNLYTDAHNRLQSEVLQLLLELNTLQHNLTLGQAAIAQRAEEYQIAQLRYSGGKALLLELYEAANQLRAARLQQLEEAFRYEKARLRFELLLALEQEPPGAEKIER